MNYFCFIQHAVPFIKVVYDQKLMHIQALELVKCLWSEVLLMNELQVGELIRTPSRLLFTAAELGIVEFLIELIRVYPDLIWKVDTQSRSIFHIAVVHRQEKVFNLIHEIGALKDLIASYRDENYNNMLHLAGKLAPSDRLKTDSGAALQLRRELHWFKVNILSLILFVSDIWHYRWSRPLDFYCLEKFLIYFDKKQTNSLI